MNLFPIAVLRRAAATNIAAKTKVAPRLRIIIAAARTKNGRVMIVTTAIIEVPRSQGN